MTNTTKKQTPCDLPQSETTRTFYTAYGPKQKIAIAFDGPGRTKQQFKDECDINKIMSRFQMTNTIDWLNQNPAQYIDCTGFDYDEAMRTVAAANSLFQSMPSNLRSQFDNDPRKFVEFVENPQNRSRLEEMGLARPQASKQPDTTNPPSPTQPAPVSGAPVGTQDAPGT